MWASSLSICWTLYTYACGLRLECNLECCLKGHYGNYGNYGNYMVGMVTMVTMVAILTMVTMVTMVTIW